ncbi:FAD dependent oxidoreductase [Pseudonocardia hierapolitana]|uniref:FAD dependent oxidoreductase n=1 Tax=Pseudonocardia hierapolitana TaxID=1128676 RepID=A0A561SUH6_9PSEU|nr:FAD-dependent oxidoreductase [Pseudonocardia hierapolitana]TWF78523.1 FAD dependent oxidoreductase [Pseudonocardia hierapolitana]
MRTEHVESDLTVIGGGLAGCCAAIAAARQGARVALVQNRPVLGGNSSSEIRVWVCGATAHGAQRYARETGIMGELFVENQYTNPDGNPYYWDLVLLEAVRAEPNLSLFLNTDVRDVEADGPADARVIRSVTGWTMGSERVVTFTSPAFVDCSGDGLVGHLAGAEYRTGREARAEFGESWAPEVPDEVMLGSTILFYSTDAGHPVPFVPPSFAKDIRKTSILDRRVIRADAKGCAFWWIEWGGERDIVHDNEEIRDELQAAVYGIWDHIKNSGEFDADNLTLEWIGSVPGKREYRRFVGDHVLIQHDVLEQTEFPDRVAFGGWSIDLHPPGGMYATEPGSRHWHPDGVYHIPLRCLYSRNVTNMWMAGRTISASHVAFGTTRVMATCAVGGEAAGTAAALAVQRGLTPRELATEHIDVVHRALTRADGPPLGVPADDPADLALTARVRASSQLRTPAVEVSDGTEPLDEALGLVLPVHPSLGALELLVDADRDAELVAEVHATGKPQNYLPARLVATATAAVPAGEKQWVRLDVGWRPDTPQNAFVVLRADPSLAVHHSATAEPGTLFFRHREPTPDERWTEQWRAWKRILQRESLCFRLVEPTSAFAPARVVGGHARPYGGPQMWVSERLDHDREPWVELRWDEPVTVAEVALVLDDDVEEDLINLHHHHTPFRVLPTLLRDYDLQLDDGGGWRTVARVMDNRRRHRVHTLDAPVSIGALRVVARATNGAPRAHVVSVRAYGSATDS